MSRTIQTKPLTELKKLAKAHGYTVSRTKGDHCRLTREGYPTVHHSGTSSDWRAVRNLRGQLRRALQTPTTPKEPAA